VDARLTGGAPAALADLAEFVAIPSVSAQPGHAADVVVAAGWLASRLRRAGLAAEVVRTAGHPVVLGSWRGAPGRPTVLIYGHYDVQPPGPALWWRSPPFTPQRRGDRLYGRGASDDKGQLWCHVVAIHRLLRARGSLPVNVVCLFEGEEEVGSPSLPDVLDRYRAELAADVLLVSDTTMPGPGRPAIVRSLRGAAALEVRVDGPRTDLHSGTYGGAVHNPALALCELVTTLHDPDGTVLVPGFYAGVRRLRPYPGPHDAEVLRRAGVSSGWGLPGTSLHERTTVWPAISVHGLTAGYTGPGTSSVIPHTALARIGVRVAPGQDPRAIADAVTRHLAWHGPPAVRTAVRLTAVADPVEVRRDTPGLRAAVRACTAVFGVPPVQLRSGGTIPALGMLRSRLGLDPVLLGFGLPGDRIHAPDESLHLPTFARGVATVTDLLDRLGGARVSSR
jgi:acetylornithine deacetylase/succinyl-diaminopimelate desuccinylase-like protein